jgi:hypothetical protein
MHSSSLPLMHIEATDALLQALTKVNEAVAPGVLSNDEAFELAALRFLAARALHMAARIDPALAV